MRKLSDSVTRLSVLWGILVILAALTMGAINYQKPLGTINADGVLDRITGGTRVITTDHSMIHEALAFSAYIDSNAVPASGSINLVFRTPDTPTYVHFKKYETFATSARATVTLVEAVTCASCTTGAPTITPVNRRRVGTPTVSGVKIYSRPVATGGTVIEKTATGGGGTGSGTPANSRSTDIEFVLKPATLYQFKVVNDDGQAKDIALWSFWYEEGGY